MSSVVQSFLPSSPPRAACSASSHPALGRTKSSLGAAASCPRPSPEGRSFFIPEDQGLSRREDSDFLGDDVHVPVLAERLGPLHPDFRTVGHRAPVVFPVPKGRCDNNISFFSRIDVEPDGAALRLNIPVCFPPDLSHRVGIEPSGVMNAAFADKGVFFLPSGGEGETKKSGPQDRENEEGKTAGTAPPPKKE